MRPGKIAVVIFLILSVYKANAQRKVMNMAEHDEKLYYFGITFGFNYSVHQVKYTSSFANTDTFLRIQPHWRPGFNLGLMGNLRLGRFFDLRFIPSLSFAEKNLEFEYGYPTDSVSVRSIESILIHLPVQVKFKSDRINNFRFYGLVGGKFDYDMASNSRSRRTDEFLKIAPIDFGYELGVGFEFYNPNFIFSPEIKLSQGLNNQLFRDANLQLTNAIQSLHTRMIVISIHLEG
jgi:opacity protein-like surface antigen